jgi:hypothetical protein
MTDVRRFGGLTCAEADDLAPAAASMRSKRAKTRRSESSCRLPGSHPAFASFALTGRRWRARRPGRPPASVKARLLAAVTEDLAGALSTRRD